LENVEIGSRPECTLEKLRKSAMSLSRSVREMWLEDSMVLPRLLLSSGPRMFRSDQENADELSISDETMIYFAWGSPRERVAWECDLE
jgi:hypothetical protein